MKTPFSESKSVVKLPSLQSRGRALARHLRLVLFLSVLLAFASTANATLISILECTCTNITLQVEGYPDITGNPFSAKIGDTNVSTISFSFANQTMVISRPPNLPGGKYWIEIYKDGVLYSNRELAVCDCPCPTCCVPGPMGPPGLPGTPGTNGLNGVVGAKGETGLTGLTGLRGVTGLRGLPGTAGTNGLRGPVGPVGPAGVAGAAGPRGVTGIRGLPGIIGPAGTNGLNGAVGLAGAVGPIGPAGPKGNTGASGVAGAIGPVGPMGLKGDAGAVGLAGAVGPGGTNGLVGAVGPAGPAGIAGAKGDIGAIGLTGAVGPAGPSGAKGDAGVVGPVGPAGAKGDAGAVGLAGAVGPAGPAGPAGAKGDTGAVGLTGANGTPGLTGATGPAGPTGAVGATGPAGPGGSSQFGYIYSRSAQVVAVEAPVAFDENGVGTAGIGHSPGSAGILIVNAGAYKITFSISGTEPNQFALFVNGIVVADSVYASGAGTQQNTGQSILLVAAGDIVTLHNHSSAAAVTLATPIGGTAAAVNASILIQQLD